MEEDVIGDGRKFPYRLGNSESYLWVFFNNSPFFIKGPRLFQNALKNSNFSNIMEFGKKAQVFLAFLKCPKELRRPLITSRLERLCKEIKRRTKVVEVFVHEEGVEKLLSLFLSGINKRLRAKRPRGFAESKTGGYHVEKHNKWETCCFKLLYHP